jgi:hypothetical protein
MRIVAWGAVEAMMRCMGRVSSDLHDKGSVSFCFDDLFGRDRKVHAFIKAQTPEPHGKSPAFSAEPEHPGRFR